MSCIIFTLYMFICMHYYSIKTYENIWFYRNIQYVYLCIFLDFYSYYFQSLPHKSIVADVQRNHFHKFRCYCYKPKYSRNYYDIDNSKDVVLHLTIKMKYHSNYNNSYFPSWVYFLTTFFNTLAFSIPSTFINIAFFSCTAWNLNSIDINFDRSSGKPNGQSTTFYSSINVLDWLLNNDLQWRKSLFGFNDSTFIAIAFYRIYALITW